MVLLESSGDVISSFKGRIESEIDDTYPTFQAEIELKRYEVKWSKTLEKHISSNCVALKCIKFCLFSSHCNFHLILTFAPLLGNVIRSSQIQYSFKASINVYHKKTIRPFAAQHEPWFLWNAMKSFNSNTRFYENLLHQIDSSFVLKAEIQNFSR